MRGPANACGNVTETNGAEVRLAVVETAEELQGLEEAWGELHRSCEGAIPFNHYEWVRHTWRHESKGWRLCILTAREGRRLVGVAPLSRRRVLGQEVFRFVHGVPWGYVGPLIADRRSDVARAMGRYLATRWPRAVLYGALVRVGAGATDEMLDGFRAGGGRACEWPCMSSPYMKLGGSFEQYLARRSGKARKSIRYRERKASAAGAVTVVCFQGREVTEAVVARLRSVEQKSWQGDQHLTAFDKSFFRDVVLGFGQWGAADAWMLTIGGEDAAFLVDLVFCRRVCFFKMGYDVSYANAAPGATLWVHVIRDAFERGFEEIDFLQGEGEHKAFWATGWRSVRRVVLYRSLGGWLFSVPYRAHHLLSQSRWARKAVTVLRWLTCRLTSGVVGNV